jgi:hypothetical protein
MSSTSNKNKPGRPRSASKAEHKSSERSSSQSRESAGSAHDSGNGKVNENVNTSVHSPPAKQESPDHLAGTIAMIMKQNAVQTQQMMQQVMQQNAEQMAKMMQLFMQQSTSGQISASVGNHPNMPAAIEERWALPTPTKLYSTDKVISAQSFEDYKQNLLNTVDSIPRFAGILRKKPAESWAAFQAANSKFRNNGEYLERKFLEVNKQLWAHIAASFDTAVILQIADEIKKDANFCTQLQFVHASDEEFYQDSYALLDKLKTRYQLKSEWQITELLTKLDAIRYDGTSHPDTFINELHNIQLQIKLLVPEYQLQSDKLQAIHMISRLPPTMGSLKQSFLNQEKSLSLKDVEDAVRNWFQVEKQQKQQQASGVRPTPQPKAADRAYYSKQHTNKSSKRKQRSGIPEQTAPTPREQAHAKHSKHHSEDSSDDGESIQDHHDAMISVEEDSAQAFAAATTATTEQVNRKWTLDSAATSHFTGNKHWLKDPQTVPTTKVRTLTGEFTVNLQGGVIINPATGVHLNKCKFVPGASTNLLSIPTVTEHGYIVVFAKDSAYIINGKNAAGLVNLRRCKQKATVIARKEGPSKLYTFWHQNKEPLSFSTSDLEHEEPGSSLLPCMPEQKSAASATSSGSLDPHPPSRLTFK